MKNLSKTQAGLVYMLTENKGSYVYNNHPWLIWNPNYGGKGKGGCYDLAFRNSTVQSLIRRKILVEQSPNGMRTGL